MVLTLEIGRDDVRRLRRTATRDGGFGDLALAILANGTELADGSMASRLTTWALIERFERQRDTGEGGYQHLLRSMRPTLIDGSALSRDWPEIRGRIERERQRRAGTQLAMSFEFAMATTFAA